MAVLGQLPFFMPYVVFFVQLVSRVILLAGSLDGSQLLLMTLFVVGIKETKKQRQCGCILAPHGAHIQIKK